MFETVVAEAVEEGGLANTRIPDQNYLYQVLIILVITHLLQVIKNTKPNIYHNAKIKRKRSERLRVWKLPGLVRIRLRSRLGHKDEQTAPNRVRNK